MSVDTRTDLERIRWEEVVSQLLGREARVVRTVLFRLYGPRRVPSAVCDAIAAGIRMPLPAATIAA